jgi:hypothetical protein
MFKIEGCEKSNGFYIIHRETGVKLGWAGTIWAAIHLLGEIEAGV